MTVKGINAELARRGLQVRLEKGSGYFYFAGGEAESWINRTVNVASVNSLTLEEWVGEFERLRKLQGELLPQGKKGRGKAGLKSRAG